MFRNVYGVFLYVCMYVCIALVLASELNEVFSNAYVQRHELVMFQAL